MESLTSFTHLQTCDFSSSVEHKRTLFLFIQWKLVTFIVSTKNILLFSADKRKSYRFEI